MNTNNRDLIQAGEAVLGIELGSTRIKAVIIGDDMTPIASGGHSWENSQIEGIWTYSLDEVWEGMQSCYGSLKKDVQDKYGVALHSFKSMGISAMMHGYLVFDSKDNQLTPFRTWRNNITEEASQKLTTLFDYPIPQRWSIAHLYQSILKNETHCDKIDFMTTLSGYVHWKLTGQKVLGVGDASGMFPIDTGANCFNATMISKFNDSTPSQIRDLGTILPGVLTAGKNAGYLSKEGTMLIDPSGELKEGIQLGPPEGDAGTGMVATNSVRVRTGNVSAGTSVFAMLVLEKELSRAYNEIDLVTTPDGSLVAMAHSNNCSSEYSAWIDLFGEAAALLGSEVNTATLYDKMMTEALKGDADCGGLLAYGYHSGEHLTGFSQGRPLVVRSSDSQFSLANFMRAQLFTALCAMRTGLDILTEKEGVTIDEIKGHGGFFKTPGVGEKIMAAATATPVSILDTAGEGGAWGIALLAAFAQKTEESTTLPDFLDTVFSGNSSEAIKPDQRDVEGFQKFFHRYHRGLAIEQAAVDNLK